MISRRMHKIVGIMLILPMLGWTCTGLVFLTKPGYKDAYEQLTVKAYPLEKSFIIPASTSWQEATLIRSILGYHLLVNDEGNMLNLNPITFQKSEIPSHSQLTSLLKDAFSNNKQRYGEIVSITDEVAKTSTGIEVRLNWNTLTLRQKGKNTKLISTLYKIHYLQWSPFKSFNLILGIVGLLLLITIIVSGIRISITKCK